MKKLRTFLVYLSVIFSAPILLKAQHDVSAMIGQVTDTTDAAVPGAVVTLTNKAKGLTFTQTTNDNGSYRFSDIPPGAGYEVTFSHAGFAALVVKDLYLTVATTRTQNAKLLAGAAEEVEVTASNSEVTVDTSDASIGNNFDVKQLNNLPVQQRNDPTALFTLQPGVTDTASVTGARSDQNNVTLDGLDVNDFATGGSTQNNSGVTQSFVIVGHAPIDSVEEFRGTVGGLGANAGPSSGGQFDLVTKSGTNQFHGNINEYHRDPSLVANGWFNNNATPIVPRNHLIQNQFGGNLGGPILKNRLFFFFDYNNSRIIAAESTTRTVPLNTLRNGIIQYINNDATGGLGQINAAQIAALDPQGVGADTTWQTAFDARFPVSNASGGDGINSGGFTFNSPNNDFETNYVGRVDYNLTSKMKMFARFTIARENSVNAVNQFPADQGIDAPFIDRTYAFVIGHNWQIGSNKNNQFFIGETVQKYDFPVLPASAYNTDGPNWYSTGDGTGPSLTSTLTLSPNTQARRVPIPVIGDNFLWTKGSHTWAFGGTFKDILARDLNVADFNSVQLGMGGHLFSLCGPTPGECASGNPALPATASLRPSDLDEYGPNYGPTATYTYDSAFAFLLGRVANIGADFNYNLAGVAQPQLSGDTRSYRYYQTQIYAGDTWKATPNLTISYGVNYQLFSVPYETRGFESVEQYSYNNYMSARVAQSTAGKSGATAVPLISYVRGGLNGPPLYQPEHHLFAPRVAFVFNPSWDKKTVFNLGAGLVYDRTIINAIQFVQDQYSYLFQQSNPIAEGNPADPYDSIRTDPRLDKNNGLGNVTNLGPAPQPVAPYAPFNTPSQCLSATLVQYPTPCGLALGSAFNSTIDPTLKTPYSIALNAGMQTAFPGNLVLKMNYAGRLGRRLLAQADANQVLDFVDPASGQLFSTALGNVTKQLRAGVQPGSLTPQPWFENEVSGYGSPGTVTNNLAASGLNGFMYRGDIGDFTQGISTNVAQNIGSAAQYSENTFYTSKGFSSYNALLLTLSKNLSHGLQFDFNYTFAHSIDNVSFFANSQGDTGIGGIGLVCDDIRPRECRGSSDFDVTHYITADTTYQLPFGKHRMLFSNSPIWVNEIIGGWDISGITDWHTGQAWSDDSNAFVASFSNDAPAILVGPASNVATHVTKLAGGGVNIFANNTLASNSFEGPIGFLIGSRNTLRGPRYFNEDLGLAKAFPLYAERVNLRFRADAFNAFNHPNFAIPVENGYNGFDNQDFTNPDFGQITNTVTPPGNLNNGARVLQLSLRLEF